MRASSLANNPLAVTRELDGRYDVVLQVRDNLDLIEQVAGVDFAAILAELESAQDFTGITVVTGPVTSWDPNTKVLTVATVKGDKGDTGATGPQGIRGLQGIQGPIGLTGAAGVNGRDGIDGRNGVDGIDGLDGIDGSDLTIEQISYDSNTGKFLWQFSDGTTYVTPDLKGPKGDTGSKGDKGDQGIGVHHIKGTSTTDSEGDFASYGEIDTYTVYGDAAETINLGYFRVNNGLAKDGQHSIMYGSTYDTNGNGIVDNSERLGGELPSHYVNVVDNQAELALKADATTVTTGLATKINNSEKGVANGVATLDVNGKVVLTQMPDSILGQLEYVGTWNFTTMPTATQKGQYWIANVSGNGYVVGDWAVWNGVAFDKVDNTDAVASVAGRTGNVVLIKTDVGLANVDNTADNVKNVLSATKWTTARTLSLTGDVTGSSSIDGSANANITMTLANSGVTAGTYSNVTVDGKGRVTAATNPTTIAGFGITDAYTKTEVLGSFGRLSNPLLDLPLKNSLTMKAGVGSATFTRASTATYIDRYGVLKTADIDEPRFEKEGYLNEGSSTNLLTYSDNMLIGYGKSRATLTLSTTELSPNGITYASEFRETTDIGSSYLFKSTTFTAGTTYTYSVFAKSINGQNLRLPPFSVDMGFDKSYAAVFDLTNGTISVGDASYAKIVPLSNGWYRCSVTATCTTTATGNAKLMYMGTEYNSPDYGLYLFGAQLEALPFATSYIPTTDSAVTRSVDVLQVTRENNFPNAENNEEGYSVAFAYDSLGFLPNGNQFLWSLYITGQNYNGGYLALASNSLRSAFTKNGSAVSNSMIPVKPLGSNKVVQIQSNTFLKQYTNGTLADTDVNTLGTLGGGVNSLTNITVGGISGISTGNLFGHISDFKVYDRELTPVEVALL
ncbi:MAG: collagen-like protein [Prevotella sp.]